MKKIILLLVSIFFQLHDAVACKQMPGSTLIEDNIAVARIAFYCNIFVVAVFIYLMKYYNWKKLLRSLLIILLHPFVWFVSYADCAYMLKYLSVAYAVIVLLIVLFLIMKKERESTSDNGSSDTL